MTDDFVGDNRSIENVVSRGRRRPLQEVPHNLQTLLRWTKIHGTNGSFIAATEVNTYDLHDPDPGIDPTGLREHLQPA